MRTKFFLVLVGLGGATAAASVPIACVHPVYPEVSFRCSPSAGEPFCPDGYLCCSDDPAAVSGDLPGYLGRGAGATPYFSGANNGFSSTGLCVEDGLLAPGQGLAEPQAAGCPVPCNPRWSASEVAQVCGASSLCCQTVEMGALDCVLDDGCWRPARGEDIYAPNVAGSWGQGPDPWAPVTHETHQDPGGHGCRAFAQGNAAAEQDCFTQLSVADQRGMCLTLSAKVQACPLTDPGYIDPCERLNIQEGRSCG
jgi:hypothetical protein